MRSRRRIAVVAGVVMCAIIIALVYLLWPKEVWTGGAGRRMTIDLGDGVTMEFVEILPGEFMMGSVWTLGDTIDEMLPPGIRRYWGWKRVISRDETPRHRVRITRPFWMGVTEVTQAQYEAVMGGNPSFFKGAGSPVEQVSWDDAVEFCRKLTDKCANAQVGAGLKPAPTFRLPTEAEWEYACRAGNRGKWCFGDDEAELGDYAWYSANSGSTTHPVAQKKPNAWGLYDMHGNVWEWCADWYGDYPTDDANDPQGPSSGSYRVLRGGSWNSNPGNCRSANRNDLVPSFRYYNLGFRVVVAPR